MAKGNEDTYIAYDKLPRINGILIDSIYYKEGRFKFVPHFRHHGDKDIEASEAGVPDSIKKFFGEQEINDRIDVSYIWFRSNSSGHARMDETISVGGLDKTRRSKSLGLYRGFPNYTEANWCIALDSKYGKDLWEAFYNTAYAIPELKQSKLEELK